MIRERVTGTAGAWGEMKPIAGQITVYGEIVGKTVLWRMGLTGVACDRGWDGDLAGDGGNR